MKRFVLGLCFAIFGLSVLAAADIGFIESFSLAKDRAASLKQLIPGTEDYYYFHALHYLQQEQYEKVREQFKPWVERHGETGRYYEILTRLHLHEYDRNPQKTLQYIKERLSLTLDHQKEVAGAIPNLPTTLEPALIDRNRLRQHSFNNWENLDNFEDAGLDDLAGQNLEWRKRRNLLQRLTRPDVPNLVQLIAEDLKSPNSSGFGQFTIHNLLTMKQLDELVKLRPELATQQRFVNTVIVRLHPGADEIWRHNPAQADAYFARLWAYVSTLPQSYNSLKSSVLYHWLFLDRNQGKYDRQKFMSYLQLPRFQGYMAKAMLENQELRRVPADLNANYQSLTMMPPIGSDEALVRSYLKHFLAEANGYQEYEPLINDVYLKHLFAETKIELGLGEPEQWASMLPPEQFKQFKERVDIDFAWTIPNHFTVEQPVKLDVHLKNVPTLLIKVFEINTNNFYRQNYREVNTDINLDGMVPNQEMTVTLTESPLRRVTKSFDFPKLNKPGVYVIDFIGAGKSSRALVRKGKYHTVATTGSAGQYVRVYDETYTPVMNAKICLGGAEFAADKDGSILVPFSTQPTRKPVIVTVSDFASLDYLNHQGEGYNLVAGIHLERESLLTQRLARVLVRPSISINGIPQSVKLLTDVRLRLISTDQDGITSSTEVPDFKLFEDRESAYEFRVPPRLQSLQVSLTGEVKSLTQNVPVKLSATQSFGLNSIDLTDKTEDLHLAKFGNDYVIEVLGKTGEAKADRPVRLVIKHREFREHIQTTLKSDKNGRIMLGPLKDITSITATGPEETGHTWSLPLARHTYRQLLHAADGEAITVPYVGEATEPTRADFALFELRGNTPVVDRLTNLQLKPGYLEIAGLEPGDYDLYLKSANERIRIRVTQGKASDGYVFGAGRLLQLPGLKPVSIARTAFDAEGNLTIQLANWSKLARVHVMGTRYLPQYNAYAHLSQVRDVGLVGLVPGRNDSAHITGRDIGDEYRYVLDRKGQKKYPGNLLEKPSILLNPWAIRNTDAVEQLAAEGAAFGTTGAPAPGAAMDAAGAKRKQEMADEAARAQQVTPNLDYLAEAAAVVLNLTPNDEGIIKIAKLDLANHAWIHVVAVDPIHTTAKSVSTTEQPASFLDLRLKNGLDPKGHFTQQKQISVLNPGQELVMPDISNSRFEMYDQFARLFTLYRTLTNDPKLIEFSFLLNWPTLKIEEKRTLYSKYACHELSFFLAQRDKEFFTTIIKPYLANKKDKTFMDHWLLGADLAAYLEPWVYARLNIVEKVLLAQRIASEQSAADRHLSDLHRMLPPDLERMLLLFDTSVKGGDMSTTSEFSVAQSKTAITTSRPAGVPALNAPGSGGPMGGAGGLGGGGMGGRGGFANPSAPMEAGKPMAPAKGEGRMAMRRSTADAKDGLARDKEQLEKLSELDATKELKQKTNEALYYKEDRGRVPARQLYVKLNPTQEWAENNYYHLPIEAQLADLVGINGFWLDYVKKPANTAFYSKHFPQASRNFTEMMFALAVLELPYTPGKHDIKFDAGKMTLKPGSPLIAFHEEVKPAVESKTKLPILVSQNFYRPSDRYREEGGERIDHFITEEFLIHTTYGCQIVVTNPTSSRQKLTVLYQLPVGAMPLGKGQQTKSVLLDLEPYRTQTIDFLFYFPAAGKFDQFPVHVAKNEQYVAFAQPQAFSVVEKPSKVDTGSWDYISQDGTPEQVLALMNRENLYRLNLEKIAFRMKDKGFFQAVTKLLRERHVYQNTLWSYAVAHNTLPELKEFLRHADSLIQMCGNGPLVSTPLTIDPVARHHYQHLEYKPLVNARAHSLGKTRQIVNLKFHQQYHQFMTMLSYKRNFDDADWLAITYYLLLQDRVEEALDTFGKINAEKLATKMQYDYCAAYLAFFTEELPKARAIAAKYASHPVDRWKNTFASITNQIDEIEGKETKATDKDDRAQRQALLAAQESTYDFTIDARKINLTWQNVEAVTINYYLMDVELLFSRNPFVQQYGSQFSAIKPNQVQDVKLPADQRKLAIELPKELQNRNVLVEIVSGGKTRMLPYYANALEVSLQENYGQLKVVNAATSKALSKVYVKVYVRLADGTVKFHKDGYTDLRGKFDYATVSTPEKAAAARYSILVMSDEFGALIREANPPAQ